MTQSPKNGRGKYDSWFNDLSPLRTQGMSVQIRAVGFFFLRDLSRIPGSPPKMIPALWDSGLTLLRGEFDTLLLRCGRVNVQTPPDGRRGVSSKQPSILI